MKKSYKSQLRRLLVFVLAIALIGSLGMPVMAHAQTNEISLFSYEIEDGVDEELAGESAAELVYDPPEEPADEPVYEAITSLGSGSNLTAPTLDVSSASGRPGDIISVTVSIQDNPGVSGFWLTMQYPEESLEFIEAVPGDIVSRYFSVFTGTPNRISIRAVAPAPPENVEIEGELFTIYFRILWGTMEGRIDGISIGYHRELDTIAHSFEHLPRATNQEVEITVTALGTYIVTYEFTGTVPTGAAALLPAAQNNVAPGTPMTRAPAPTLEGYTFSGWTTTADITLDGDNFYMPDDDVLFTGYWTVDSQVGIDSWVALREAVDAAPANVPTTIAISNSFVAPSRQRGGDEIVIPSDRDITLVSTNTEPGEDNVRTLTQPNNRALFAVDGSLTLGQNITLNDSVVSVLAGGTLTMNEGSVIENSTDGGLALLGSGTAEDTRATFYMNGGMIRNNTRWSGSGVRLYTNSRMYMSGGYIIGNTAIDRGGGIEIASVTAFVYMSGGAITGNAATSGRGGGVALLSWQHDAFTMTGGSITNNTAYHDGGGIYSSNANHSMVVPVTSYRGLNIGEAAIFYGNTAGNGASAPPDNRLPHIAVTLTSIWNYALNNYDINYRGRLGEEPIIVGHSVTYQFTGTVPAGAAALLPAAQNNVAPGTPMTRASAPTLEGYTFSGWTTASDITLDGDNFYMPDNDILFTGYWTSDSQDLHEITFDTNGGRFYFTGLPSTHVINVQHGNPLPYVSSLLSFFSRPHYTFIGWCSAGDGGSILTPTQLYEWIVEGPQTFTAIWEERWFDITFDLAGGYIDSDPSPLVFNIRSGQSFSTRNVTHPARTGYVFMGWWCSERGIWVTNSNMSSVSRPWSFTAVWESESNNNVVVDSWVALREAVNAAPANVPTTIEISHSFEAPVRPHGDEIVIPADRDVTLVSTNTAPGEDNVRTLTQPHWQHHFIVYGSLTLDQNITLSGGGSVSVSVRAGGTLTMNDGSVIEYSTRGGVDLFSFGTTEATRATFYMNGGIIRNNTNWSGSGVRLSTNSRMYMSGGYIVGNMATSRGGGLEIVSAPAFVYMSGGSITGNAAIHTTGGIGVGGGVSLSMTAPNAFTMTGGSITNNTASHDGGGIYSSRAFNSIILHATAYNDLYIGEAAIFYGNTAGNGASAPPDNRLPHIATTSASIWDYVLNNYDINYRGRLGEEPIIVGHSVTYQFTGTVPAGAAALLPAAQNDVAPGTPMTRASAPTLTGYTFSDWTTASDVTLDGDNFYMPDNDVLFTGHWTIDGHGGINSWESLRAAVNAAPANVPTTIEIGNSFAAPYNVIGGNTIAIPADRNITLVSTNTNFGAENVRTLTMLSGRHFYVAGNLTLGRNITLSGGGALNPASGGVSVWSGGRLTMGPGSIIENCYWPAGSSNGGAVILQGSPGVEGFAVLTMQAQSSIINNTSGIGGGIYVGYSGSAILSGGWIGNNTAYDFGGGIAVSDNGILTIVSSFMQYNEAHRGGGIAVLDGGVATLHDGTSIQNSSARYGGGVFVSDNGMLTMRGGLLQHNHAIIDGGGIYSTLADHSLTVPATAYSNLNINERAQFSSNTAGSGASAPPNNRLDHIARPLHFISIWDYPLNNYDINYRGRLGETQTTDFTMVVEEPDYVVEEADLEDDPLDSEGSDYATDETDLEDDPLDTEEPSYVAVEADLKDESLSVEGYGYTVEEVV